jgi:hypothetical protein
MQTPVKNAVDLEQESRELDRQGRDAMEAVAPGTFSDRDGLADALGVAGAPFHKVPRNIIFAIFKS